MERFLRSLYLNHNTSIKPRYGKVSKILQPNKAVVVQMLYVGPKQDKILSKSILFGFNRMITTTCPKQGR